MVGPRNYPLAVINVELLVGDATRAILVAAGTQSRYLINEIIYTSTTSAAQTVSIGGATNTIAKVGASPGLVQYRFNYGDGFLMAVNEALTITPAAAGPGAWVTVKYAKLPEFGNA